MHGMDTSFPEPPTRREIAPPEALWVVQRAPRARSEVLLRMRNPRRRACCSRRRRACCPHRARGIRGARRTALRWRGPGADTARRRDLRNSRRRCLSRSTFHGHGSRFVQSRTLRRRR